MTVWICVSGLCTHREAASTSEKCGTTSGQSLETDNVEGIKKVADQPIVIASPSPQPDIANATKEAAEVATEVVDIAMEVADVAAARINEEAADITTEAGDLTIVIDDEGDDAMVIDSQSESSLTNVPDLSETRAPSPQVRNVPSPFPASGYPTPNSVSTAISSPLTRTSPIVEPAPDPRPASDSPFEPKEIAGTKRHPSREVTHAVPETPSKRPAIGPRFPLPPRPSPFNPAPESSPVVNPSPTSPVSVAVSSTPFVCVSNVDQEQSSAPYTSGKPSPGPSFSSLSPTRHQPTAVGSPGRPESRPDGSPIVAGPSLVSAAAPIVPTVPNQAVVEAGPSSARTAMPERPRTPQNPPAPSPAATATPSSISAIPLPENLNLSPISNSSQRSSPTKDFPLRVRSPSCERHESPLQQDAPEMPSIADMVIPPPLISCSTEVSIISPADDKKVIDAVLRVRQPQLPAPVGTLPVDVVMMLDVREENDSKEGRAKLPMLIANVKEVIQGLHPYDRVGIWTCSNEAVEIIPLSTLATQKEKDSVKQKIDELMILHAGTSSCDLRTAVQTLQVVAGSLGSSADGRVALPVGILVVGKGSHHGYQFGKDTFMNDFLMGNFGPLPIHTFGVTGDHDAASLQFIARGTGGMYSCLESESDAQLNPRIVTAINTTRHRVFDEFKITIQGINGASIERVRSQFHVKADHRGVFAVNFGDWLNGESRTVYCRVRIPGAHGVQRDAIPYLRTIVTCVPVGSTDLRSRTVSTCLIRRWESDADEPEPMSVECRYQYLRNTLLDLVREAESLTRAGQMAEGKRYFAHHAQEAFKMTGFDTIDRKGPEVYYEKRIGDLKRLVGLVERGANWYWEAVGVYAAERSSGWGGTYCFTDPRKVEDFAPIPDIATNICLLHRCRSVRFEKVFVLSLSARVLGTSVYVKLLQSVFLTVARKNQHGIKSHRDTQINLPTRTRHIAFDRPFGAKFQL
ncbi:hypothetical protein HK104_005118 [Borealophlyctis nickersoniae]|nr:hypothetical protein HK104_005118 [Borealophlyctis nickersoniae]